MRVVSSCRSGRGRTPVRALAAVAALVAVSVAALAMLPTAPAAAQLDPESYVESIRRFDVDLRIEPSGALLVRETIAYGFGVVPRHGIYRDIPTRFDYPKKPDTDRVTPIDVLSVRASGGASAQYDTSTFRESGIGYTRLRIGDPDRTITGAVTYTITYRVRGALNGFPDHDELVWNATGNGWSVPIRATTARVGAPGDVQQAACAAGYFGSRLPCTSQVVAGPSASFAQSELQPREGLTVAVSIPPGVVRGTKPILEERWTIRRAFALTPTTGAATGGLLVLLVGGFAIAFVRMARDRRYRGSAVDQAFGADGAPDERVPLVEHRETPVELVPPDDLRPGLVGTLVDFDANPLDVTATIVDLAVRGHLTITELDDDGDRDWKLTRRGSTRDELAPYEQRLVDGLFLSGDEVRLATLRQHFAARMDTVRDALLDDALARGWFRGRPGRVRAATAGLGVLVLLIGVALTVALAAWTHAGLLGLPVVVLGAVITVSARWAPARTAKGYAVLRRADGFRRFIEESEKPRAEFAERANLFSEYLPYAIVFGATDRWVRRFASLADAELETSGWYVSPRPFAVMAFSHTIDRFTVTTAGTLTSTPPSTSGSSGFGGGGGFSGGGFGGGGGGSW